MKPGRTSCCVPFCGKTRRADGRFSEWLCMDHWRGVSARTKRWKRLAERALKNAYAEVRAVEAKASAFASRNEGRTHIDLIVEFNAAVGRRQEAQMSSAKAWERCKAEAIERAGGVR